MKHCSKMSARGFLRALIPILVLTLILSGCSKPAAKPADSTAAPETTAPQQTEAAATEPAGPSPEELTATCWDAGFGQSLKDYYCLQFLPDGSLRSYQYSTKTLGEPGRYTYDGRTLELELKMGEELLKSAFRWDGKGFLSTEEHQMAVGTGRYTLAPNAEAAQYFVETPTDPDWEPALNKTDLTFFGAGESYTLVLEEAPAGTKAEWSSENEEIAAVDETGRVTAVGPGSTRIYAQVGEEKLECWIRCRFDAPAGEEAPKLNKTDMSFFGVGESFRLSVENLPEGEKVTWSSEDIYVASVDENGLVTAVGPGTIRVAAQAGETTLYCWVRCQFAAPAGPRSSVEDGTWQVRLSKDGLTPVGTGPDRWQAEGQLLDLVTVNQKELERLERGSALDLTAWGMQVYRVTKAEFDADKDRWRVETDGGPKMEFRKDDRGGWSLWGDGSFELRPHGSAKLAFDENTALQDGAGKTVAHLTDLFEEESGARLFSVTVENGVVTRCVPASAS